MLATQKQIMDINNIYLHALPLTFNFLLNGSNNWSTQYRSWLRHYATSGKVAGSIPHKLDYFFSWPNPSSRIMALGSTQPLNQESSGREGKGRPACKDDNLTAICEPIV
jgi:hypothetical protein